MLHTLFCFFFAANGFVVVAQKVIKIFFVDFGQDEIDQEMSRRAVGEAESNGRELGIWVCRVFRDGGDHIRLRLIVQSVRSHG